MVQAGALVLSRAETTGARHHVKPYIPLLRTLTTMSSATIVRQEEWPAGELP